MQKKKKKPNKLVLSLELVRLYSIFYLDWQVMLTIE